MNNNDLNNKLAEYEARIKVLEQKIQDYYAELRDDTHRKDIEQDGKIDDWSTISEAQARQIITSFEQNYDAQATANVEQHRKDTPNHKLVRKYDRQRECVEYLKKRFNL